jgi:hypothetical protein
MPTQRKGRLQRQGVPFPDHLKARQPQMRETARRRVVQRRTPLSGEMGGTQTETVTYETPLDTASGGRIGNRPLRSYNPAIAGRESGSNIGLLEAEFLLALGLLILLMFANSSASYGDRIMSLMKRGTLTCLLFFFLALISTIGPNAEKMAKAFGGLVIVAILVTSPVGTVATDVDNIIKYDWAGTAETGNDTAASADSGTQTGTSPAAENAVSNSLATLGDSAVSSAEAWLLHLSGPAADTVSSAVKSLLGKLHL